MTTHDRVRFQLQALEALLREHQHWRNDEPQPHQFNSTQPFFMDTWNRSMITVGADQQKCPFVEDQPFSRLWYYLLCIDDQQQRAFWLSWKNWMLFCG